MTTEDTFTPPVADLRAIAEFIWARAMDEAGAAGRVAYYRESGGTIQPRIPKGGCLAADSAGQRAKVKGWLEEHTPDRFMAMASELAHMADGLAEAQASIWESHPEFDPAWAKDEDAES